jgi:rhamnose utilization protein RhaD (predicted bifunctional aldolase and dehydrogenase)
MTILLTELATLTRTIGEPQRDYVIIGEGNTSCRIDDWSFYIKASGQGMNGITEAGFVAVNFEPVLAMLDQPTLPLAEQKAIMNAAKVDASVALQPSVEVSFHAMLLTECSVPFIGHTHPVAVNQIMCSTRAQQFAENRLFPDEAVLCGPESVFVPYQDPGLPLAIEMRKQVRAYMDRNGEAPKVILLQNHGVIAPGATPTEVLNIMAMVVKAAQIFMGACAIGEPVFMSKADIDHIYKRPDEIYRRKQFVERL